MNRAWDVIGIGATSVDYVYRLPVLPEADGPHAKIYRDIAAKVRAQLAGGEAARPAPKIVIEA